MSGGMRASLKVLGKHSLVYGIGNVLSVAAGFLLIPLFTHVLTPADYGVMELLNRSADILMLVMFLGVRQAFIRLYFEHEDMEWRKKVVGTTTVCVILSSAVVAALCAPFTGIFARGFFGDDAFTLLVDMLLVWVPLELFVNVGLSFLQVRLQSKLYVFINASKLFLVVISNVILLYFLRKGIFGFMVTNIWVAAVVALPFFLFFIRWSRLRCSRHVLAELLKFGLPLLPATVFMFIINNSDRYLLKYYTDLEAVGIYALAFKIGMFGTMMVMDPFGKVWAPFLFDNYKKEEGPAMVSNVFTLAVFVNITVGLVISILSPPVIRVISDAAYHEAYNLVPLLCLASICYSMGNIADAGILISKKTYFSPIIHGICCVVIILLNVLLIPWIGYYGASISIALTFLARLALIRSISKRFFYFSIEYRKILLLFAYAAVTYLLFISIYHRFEDSFSASFAAVFVFFIFPFLVWYGKVFTDKNKEMVRGLVGRAARGFFE